MSPPDTLGALMRHLDELVAAFERHPDERVRGLATSLLQSIDSLHREGLTRLVVGLRSVGASSALDEVMNDPAVSVLLGLYGLAALPIPDEPSPSAPPPTGLVQLRLPDREGTVTWREVAQTVDLPPGSLKAVEVDSLRVLLANVQGELFAFRNACVGTELTLELGRLENHELSCPWHGCRYDARSGTRLHGGAGRLQPVPVTTRGTSIQLAVAEVTSG